MTDVAAPPVLADPGYEVRPAPLTRALLAAIGFYRVAISPMRPPACRYAPSCSEYALDALRTWGLACGGWMAVRRLLRCHPWHAGGHDPVPPRLAAPLSPAAGLENT